MKIVIVRRIVQVMALALLMVPLVWPLNPVWFGTYLSSQLFGFALTDPLAALEVMLAGKMIWGPLIWSIIPLLIVTI
ncbi:MAG: 4Fe-4S binding protein, partial [Sporomusa sp.]